MTAFIYMYGLFKFNCMLFGLRNARAVYCQLVAQIMANLRLKSVVHYLDNILNHSVGMDEHADSGEQVLKAYLEAGI